MDMLIDYSLEVDPENCIRMKMTEFIVVGDPKAIVVVSRPDFEASVIVGKNISASNRKVKNIVGKNRT